MSDGQPRAGNVTPQITGFLLRSRIREIGDRVWQDLDGDGIQEPFSAWPTVAIEARIFQRPILVKRVFQIDIETRAAA